MGLSEHEQKLFEQLERELAGDAKFVGKLPKPSAAKSGRMLVIGVVTLLTGLALLVVAVLLQIAFFGAAAFIVMLIGLVISSTNFTVPGLPEVGNSSPDKAPKTNFFEDRWNQRFGE
jgi:hypothetical protein